MGVGRSGALIVLSMLSPALASGAQHPAPAAREAGAAPAIAQTLEAHTAAGELERAAESHRVEIALAELVHELALTPDQARSILTINRALERTLAALGHSQEADRLREAPALVALRNRIVRGGVQAKPTMGAFTELALTDQLAEEFEGETAQAREAVIAQLDARQKTVLRAFDAERALVKVGLGDDALTEWVSRLSTLRDTPADELSKTVRESLSDALAASGHPERLATAMTIVGQARALPAGDFDAQAVDYAQRLRELFSGGPSRETTAPAAPPEGDKELADSEAAELAGAVNSTLLDGRMAAVLDAYLGASPAQPASPTAPASPRPSPSRHR